ncbi:MAG TPA: PIN domain-containing protein [Thermoanaerobaculia bacterium]|nr:PIN domain-containing protein [Thermoanaerobaculia bacterium]
MPHVVVDTNVFISLLTDRNEEQRARAKELLLRAEAGETVAVLPQFVLFEIAHVLRNLYAIPPNTAASLIGDAMALPGIVLLTEYPWEQILGLWSARISSIADAGIVAIALTNRYDAVATFDQKLIRQMTNLGVASYWPVS